VVISKVAIVNQGLIKIGQATITSFDEPNSKSARLAKVVYDVLRQETLEGHPWNFALEWHTLGAIANFTHPKFSNAFQLPTGCLRPHQTDLPARTPWKVEGRRIVCDSSALQAQCIMDITDESWYSAYFISTLATRIASELAYSVANSATLKKQMFDEYLYMLKNARTFDAQGGGTADRVKADGWLASRGSRI